MAVYFIQEVTGEEAAPIKIGYARDPIARLRELQCGNSKPLILGTYIDGNRGLERRLHVRFAKDRIRGEWFTSSKELREFIVDAWTSGAPRPQETRKR